MSKVYTFKPVLEKDPEDGRWSVWLEEIPWCCTFGDTREEALCEIQDAAEAVVEYLVSRGREIPQTEREIPQTERVEVAAA